MWGYEYIADCGDCDYDKLHSLKTFKRSSMNYVKEHA